MINVSDRKAHGAFNLSIGQHGAIDVGKKRAWRMRHAKRAWKKHYTSHTIHRQLASHIKHGH